MYTFVLRGEKVTTFDTILAEPDPTLPDLAKRILSRKPLLTLEKNSIAEDYVNFLIDHLVPKSMNRQEIEEACQRDAEIQALIAAIRTNCWPGKPAGKTAKNRNGRNIYLTPYKSIRNELTVSDNGIVLRGNRLVTPKKLRGHTLNIAHAQQRVS